MENSYEASLFVFPGSSNQISSQPGVGDCQCAEGSIQNLASDFGGKGGFEIGLIKRVRSGQSISIWEDNWLPNSASMRPMGRLRDTYLIMVNELLTANNEWNEPLIREIFFCP